MGPSACIDMTGRRVCRWTVLGRGRNKPGRKTAAWNCRCDCGTEATVEGHALRRGASLSCGCLGLDALRLPRDESGFNHLLAQYRQSARRRGLMFDLSKSQFHDLTSSDCFYCGLPPSQASAVAHDNAETALEHSRYVYSGLDRVENARGYTADNVVPCCGQCNLAKNDYSSEDFLAWAERIHNRQVQRGCLSNEAGIEPCLSSHDSNICQKTQAVRPKLYGGELGPDSQPSY